ncbi:MAG: cyclomaltodextrinase N-terminal domain-containing protein, partial [Bacteroidetes bacterium]|nr:cyclomaltodextrinase N-terminal domain-containing protein [Bacteroidota bacterium]
MRRSAILIICFLSIQCLASNDLRIEPPHWWVGMANQNLQLLVQGEDIASAQ